MANHVLDYINILGAYFGPIDYEQSGFDHDDGSDSTVAEGRRHALAEIDDQIQDLKQLREDVRCLPLKKLQAKYNC